MAGQRSKDKKKLQVWLHKDLLEQLAQASERTGLSRTELVAMALRMAGQFRAVPDKKQGYE